MTVSPSQYSPLLVSTRVGEDIEISGEVESNDKPDRDIHEYEITKIIHQHGSEESSRAIAIERRGTVSSNQTSSV